MVTTRLKLPVLPVVAVPSKGRVVEQVLVGQFHLTVTVSFAPKPLPVMVAFEPRAPLVGLIIRELVTLKVFETTTLLDWSTRYNL